MFFKRRKSFDEYVQEGKKDSKVIFLDVREEDEYASEYIIGSINCPLSRIETLDIDRSSKLFVYCRSGARSYKACKILEKIGYNNVTNIGGIMDSKSKYLYINK